MSASTVMATQGRLTRLMRWSGEESDEDADDSDSQRNENRDQQHGAALM
jgi:hypothetical protein